MNLRAVWLWSRGRLRDQRTSLVLMTLLVAVVSGVVLAGAAGARRTATVVDRYIGATNQGDLGTYVTGLSAADAPSFFEKIRGVRDAASVDSFLVQPERPGMNQNFTILSSPDGRWGTAMNRLLVRSGRLPSPGRPDEVALNRPAAAALGLGVGDSLAAETISPEAFQRLVTGQGNLVFDGPRIRPKIVGVVDVADDLQGSTQQSAPLAVGSPAFGRRYAGEIAVGGSATTMRTDERATERRVRDALASFPQAGVGTAAEEWIDTTRSAIDVMTIGLLVFAAIALVAGALVIGQTISRQLSSGADELLVARALGLTRAERSLAAGAPVLGAAVIGVLLGVPIALASSGLTPLAVAAAAEPHPGLRADPLVLSLGAVLLVALLAGWTLITARRVDRRVRAPVARRRKPLPKLLRLGTGLSPRLGVRLVLDRDAGPSKLPTRSALFGTAGAVIGVVAVMVFAASLAGALRSPSDFGWTWTSRPDLFSSGDPFAQVRKLAGDHDLAAVGAVWKSDARIGPLTVPIQAFQSVKGSIEPPVRSGRLPEAPGEVALGAATLEATRRSVGDTIELGLPGGKVRRFEVVGEAVGNQMTDTPNLGEVVVVTPAGAAELAGVSAPRDLIRSDFAANILLTYRRGVTVGPLEARLEREHQLSFPAYSHPTAPGRLHNLDGMKSLLVGIGAFLAILGALALIHLLLVSTRRRTRQFGTLRVLGLVRRQLRSIVWFQGLTIIAVGLAVGIPVGVMLGRWVWREALTGVGMVVTPTVPWPYIAAFVAVALVTTTVITLVLGAPVARSRPATVLRTE